MKKKLSFKHLFSSAWTDFTQNIMDWLFLVGMQVASLCIFPILGGMLWIPSLWTVKDGSHFSYGLYLSLYNMSSFAVVGFGMIAFVLMSAAFIIYPIMNQQNALDVTFKRSMSGFDINNRFFTFAVAMLIYGMIVSVTMPVLFLGLFLAHRWRFVGLHLLEHGGTIRQAFKASWRMTRGCVWFFIGISMIEWLLMFMISWTIIGFFVVVIMSYLIDAHLYKQLHMEMDKDIALCNSCEN